MCLSLENQLRISIKNHHLISPVEYISQFSGTDCCLLFLASPLISNVIYDTLRASLKWNRWEPLVQVSLLLRKTYIKLVLQFLVCKFVADISLL